ncbi:MAG: hypothetical protein OXI41_12180 [Chloroflexota bacterium]|nr:hypothetical protein [Chloroflexota bacterium]MDE2896638.1 hypothetical protein [Chloroflexota bacterium]
MTTADQIELNIRIDKRVKQRLIDEASRQGFEIDVFCQQAIQQALEDGKAEESVKETNLQLFERLLEERDEQFGDRRFLKTGVELIREARELRSKQMDEW